MIGGYKAIKHFEKVMKEKYGDINFLYSEVQNDIIGKVFEGEKTHKLLEISSVISEYERYILIILRDSKINNILG